jgi:hypothetical protein
MSNTFTCTRPACSFASSGWATPEQAEARGAEHIREHDTGELMTVLVAFEQSVGFERSTPIAVEAAGEDDE